MELPIQLDFFKKIELYQELKFQNKKAGKDLADVWQTEKQILKWTVLNHHHLGTEITPIMVVGMIISGEDILTDRAGKALENLIERGYAKNTKPNCNTGNIFITFTKEGLLMGRVIYDIEKGHFSNWKYPVFYYFTWFTVICGALTIVGLFLLKVLYYIYLYL